MPSEPSSDQQQPHPFDANTRRDDENDATFWFDEYEATFRRLWEDEVEIVKLRGRISELELQVRSQAPTDEAIHDLSTADLLRFARACAALARRSRGRLSRSCGPGTSSCLTSCATSERYPACVDLARSYGVS